MVQDISIYSYISKGYSGQAVALQCSIRNGFPGFDIIGLPGSCVKEARERVRCALRHSGFKFPQTRVLINLSPASQPKDSTLLDLALACSIMLTQNLSGLPRNGQDPVKVMIAGELTLNGQVLLAEHSLGAVEVAKSLGCQMCLLPVSDPFSDQDIQIIPVTTLLGAFKVLMDIANEKTEAPMLRVQSQEKKRTIFEDIIGLEEEKEILSIAASGFHSTLLFGPPGVGKTMLSTRIHLLFDKLTPKQENEVLRIKGCANIPEGQNDDQSRMRILSHDCTQAQFVCGSTAKSPGEGSLAHMGTLILDEINKFTPKLLESVKDAYDKGFTQSSRSGQVITYPSRFLMVGNLNPCPCASLGEERAICTCTAQKISSHWAKLGRPLIERFDIRIPISSPKNLLSGSLTKSKTDTYYTDKVHLASQRQLERYKYIEGVEYNGQVHFNTSALMALKDEIELYNRIYSSSNQSSRAQISLICLSRTIADYEDQAKVSEEHFHKASELRKYGLGDYYWRSIL